MTSIHSARLRLTRHKRAPIPRGFTLVEIALVVVIASILLLAGMRLMIARAESAQLEVTRRNQDAIKTALVSYLGRTQRLPCPDTNFDGTENRDVPTNPGPCNAYVGTVPYVDLGLDRSAVLDGWDNYIAYVVSPSNSVPAPPVVVPPWTTAWLYSYAQPAQVAADPTHLTNTANLAFWPTVSTGAIQVNDVTGTAISNPGANPPTGAVVVLISYGKNGYGATNVSGARNDFTAAVFDELSNINPIVAVGPPVQMVAVNRDVTDQNIVNHGPFDDIVLPLRQNDLIAPLVASGTYQSSPTQMLSQANDLVIGQIAGGRTICTGVSPCAGSPPICNVGSFYYPVPLAGAITMPTSLPVTYAPSGVTTCIASNTPANQIPPAIAYTITSQDGNKRDVTIAEAIGILGRVGGF